MGCIFPSRCWEDPRVPGRACRHHRRALTYWPMLAGQIVFHRDSALWFFPARWFVRRSLLAGEFPSWNPFQGLGFPLLADPQYGVFYALHWLFLLVPGEDHVRSLARNGLTRFGFLRNCNTIDSRHFVQSTAVECCG